MVLEKDTVKIEVHNFISLDFIDEGDGMKRVNAINGLQSDERRARALDAVKNKTGRLTACMYGISSGSIAFSN